MPHIEVECLVTPSVGVAIDTLVDALATKGTVVGVEGAAVRVRLPARTLREFTTASDALYATPGVEALAYPPATQQRYAQLHQAANPRLW
jgi:hypothetical protein